MCVQLCRCVSVLHVHVHVCTHVCVCVCVCVCACLCARMKQGKAAWVLGCLTAQVIEVRTLLEETKAAVLLDLLSYRMHS